MTSGKLTLLVISSLLAHVWINFDFCLPECFQKAATRSSLSSSTSKLAKEQQMSLVRSSLLFGASLAGAATIALVGAGAATAESGINFSPGNDGLLNSGTGNTGILNGGVGNSGVANNLLGPGGLNSGIANGLLGGSGNQGVANLGNLNNGVANIGNLNTGIANIGNVNGGLVQVGNFNLGAVNIGNGRTGILRLGF
jgi:hypothetical protein